MYSIYDVFYFGAIILLLYIIIDFSLNKTRNLLKRMIFYSFAFYMLVVFDLTIGGIVIPPLKDNMLITQLVPLFFIKDLFSLYKFSGIDWFFWNSLKLTFFNFIMLMPLGIYLSVLFKVKERVKSILIIFLVSLGIETLQYSLTYWGLIMERGFNVDDIIVNTLGGFIAFVLCESITKAIIQKYLKSKTKAH